MMMKTSMMMTRSLLCASLLVVLCGAFAFVAGSAPISGFRPPAVPLVVMDPYMSIWSFANQLTDTNTTLWDGDQKPMTGLIRIDKEVFRWMGQSSASPMTQKSVVVTPTSTVYTFEQAGVQLVVTFLTPMLPSSLELMARPITYLTLDASSTDGKIHSIELYYDVTGLIAVNQGSEQVTWSRQMSPKGLDVARMGTTAQNIFGVSGDGVGLNWGYFYLASSSGEQAISLAADSRARFLSDRPFVANDTRPPAISGQDYPALVIDWKFTVSSSQSVAKSVILAYDDVYSIEYFGEKMKAYWTRQFSSIVDLIDQASADYTDLQRQAASFDQSFFSRMSTAGGDEYSTVTALAYRQVVGGAKFVWASSRDRVWYFMKEISSDGDLSTMDVIFPASSFFLYYNASWLDLLLQPLMAYANNETYIKYNLAWVPHHLGPYPIGNLPPNKQENMPVEETGNMFLMLAAIAQRYPAIVHQGGTVSKYASLLRNWAEYLKDQLPDPGNQLTTDDFAGPTPHDSNLAAKGILGLQGYAILCTLMGDTAGAATYSSLVKTYATKWMVLSNPNNTDHTRLRYDQEGWSLKYNLVWQNVLKQDVFPQSLFDSELAYYHSKMNAYGVPLDVRKDYTKIDWESWCATFAPTTSGFASFFHPLYKFANETTSRVPLTDWYWTTPGTKSGFQARPVLGAFWLQAVLKGV